MADQGRLLPVHDTSLYVVERGASDGLPVLVLHGGPGLDHLEFGHWLDALTDGGRYRLVLVDQRAQGRSDRSAPEETWTLQTMASDVSALAAALGTERYAVLGHSFGAFVALQHAVDAPGAAVATVVSGGVPATSFLAGADAALAAMEPAEVRERVAASLAREATADTEEEVAALLADQMPFHFADPLDPRIAEYLTATADTVYAPAMLRHFASVRSVIEVQDRLGSVSQPVLVVQGRHDRVCPVAAAEATAAGLPHAQLEIMEGCGHMSFVEDPDRYVALVRDFLDRATG